jgi:hypothetical protein
MKRALAILACLCVLAGGEFFAISKWAIRQETLNLFDATRQRPVSVEVAVRRDYELKANDDLWHFPIAIISTEPQISWTRPGGGCGQQIAQRIRVLHKKG